MYTNIFIKLTTIRASASELHGVRYAVPPFYVIKNELFKAYEGGDSRRTPRNLLTQILKKWSALRPKGPVEVDHFFWIDDIIEGFFIEES